jgi:hypothetical protein
MLKSVSGYPSGKTVSVKVIDNTGTVHQDWDSSIVTEVSIASSRSIYHADLAVVTSSFKGFIFWKTSDATPIVASEALNVYAALGFPSSKTVSFKTVDSTGTTVDDWTATDVTEYVIDTTAAKSVYMANPSGITVDFTGVLLWKDNSATPYTASQAVRGIATTASTLSGTRNFTLTKSKIIQSAYYKIQRIAEGATPSAIQMEVGSNALNSMWSSAKWQKMRLWQEKWITQTLTASSKILGTDNETYTCILGHTSATNNKPITGANYTTYWYKTGSGGSVWVSGADYTCIADFNLSTDIMDISKAYIRENYVDNQLSIIDMPDFFDIYDKRIQSKSTTMVIDKKLTPHVYLWPQPNDTTHVLHMLAIYRMQDFTNADDIADAYDRWLNAIEWNLALELCPNYNIQGTRLQLIISKATESYQYAKADNKYSTSEDFVVGAFG